MKKHILILIIALLTISLNGIAQKSQIMDKPKVDNRVELLSIVSRLAEYQEYSATVFKLYTDKIEEHFKPYKDHELIQFMKEMRSTRGVGYDAVMGMAVNLDQNLDPRTEFTDKIPESRWGKEKGYEFVRLLKQFYTEAKCEEFFASNRDLYTKASERFLPVFEHLDLSWYSSFYGEEPKEKFIVINGLGNGGGNYGVNFAPADGEKEVFAIMGTWSVDSVGISTFALNAYFPTLLHEFNHSFVNHLIYNNKDAFRDSGEKIFSVVGDEMRMQAYASWETVLCEALVRAAVIKYMKDHNFDADQIEGETKAQLDRSFFWIKELVGELENYDRQRNIYPTLGSYMPKIIEAYKGYADKAPLIDEKRPKVVSINEFTNGDTNVSSSIQKITINFDKPLLGKGYSIFYGNKGQDAFPKFGDMTYSEDKKTLLMEVNLEKGKEYQFVLTGRSFKTEEGIGMKNYEISFKTSDE